MALRCPRCSAHEIALETFGVYRCVQCGRIDADGRLLTSESAPGAPAFAPPPPAAVAGPSAADLVRKESLGGSAPPPFFLAMVSLDALLIGVVAIASGNIVRAFLSYGFLVPLMSGKEWARALALLGAMVEIVLVVVLFTASGVQWPGWLRALFVLDVVAQVVWIYTLFRADTVRYFAQKR